MSVIDFASPSYRSASSDLTIQVSPLGLIELADVQSVDDIDRVCGMARGKKAVGYSTKEPLYAVWKTMLARCENPNHNQYPRYGGRGIIVCEEWHDYETFRDWATSHGYRKGLQIDRVHVNENYEARNCRFVSSKDQNRNRSNNRLITAFGTTKSLAEWADDARCAVPYKMLWERLQDGWEFNRAIAEPQRRKGGYRMIEAFGETKSVTEWVDDRRCNAGTVTNLWARINYGWLAERAITAPLRGRG